MNGGIINSITRLHLVDYFYCVGLKFSERNLNKTRSSMRTYGKKFGHGFKVGSSKCYQAHSNIFAAK